jgi:dTDP-4-amino-4,6-dideoxygalactose transaminase
MKISIANLPKQYRSVKKDVDRAVKQVLTTGQFTLGDMVDVFEHKIAKFVGVKDAVGVNSGTDALVLAMKALGIGRGDEVIMPPFTFVATAEAAIIVGAKPVFVDIDAATFNIDPKLIGKAITRKTKAIMPVHLFGQMADMRPIMRIAKKHRLAVIEDAAQAIGASQHGKKAGSVGTLGCFSLFPTKNLGAYGDGGFITSHDKKIADHLRVLRAHGSSVKYIHEHIGMLSRLHALQAAIVTAKLPHLPKWNKRRREIAAMYARAFKDVSAITTPRTLPGNTHVFHQYTIRAERRNELQRFLAAQGIGTAIHFPIPIHLQKGYRFLKYRPGTFPVSEAACAQVLSLPMYPELTNAEVRSVVSAVKAFYRAGK